MSNILSIISWHNKNIEPCCYSIWLQLSNREICSRQKKCLARNIIYRADVRFKVNNDYKFYLGVAQTYFKERLQNYNRDFSHRQYIKSTDLSKWIWPLKDAGTPYNIKCPMIPKVQGSTKIIVYYDSLKNITS